MKFSLVLATINRTAELKRFLHSLDVQTYRNFELVVVDQNLDDRLAPILDDYANRWDIIHLRSEKGLSRARNFGLANISGDVVCFPDDDCWYPPYLLYQVASLFQSSQNYDGITGISVDELGNPFVANSDFSPGLVTKLNVWRRCTSITIFIKTSSLHKDDLFDENLGVGAGTPWGGGEDDDFLLHLIQKKLKIYYTPEVKVGHPIIYQNSNTVARYYSYGCGVGRVLRKYNYPFWFFIYSLLRPFGGMLISLFMGKYLKARHHRALLIGRFKGWHSK